MTQGEPIRELYLTRDILKQPLSSERVGGIGDYGVSPVRSYRHSGGNRKAMAGPGTYPIGIFKSVEDAVINGYLPLKTSKDITLGTVTYPKGSKLEDLIQGSSSISKGVANTILYYNSTQDLTSSSNLEFDGQSLAIHSLQETDSIGVLGYDNMNRVVKSNWLFTEMVANSLYSPMKTIRIAIEESGIYFEDTSYGALASMQPDQFTVYDTLRIEGTAASYNLKANAVSGFTLSDGLLELLRFNLNEARLTRYNIYRDPSGDTAQRFLITNENGVLRHSSLLFYKDGKIGINNDDPSVMLEVDGHATINGTLTADSYENLFAEDIPYDNTLHVDDTHGLQADNVQAAIDELEYKKANVSDLGTNVILFPTTSQDPSLPYNVLVTSTEDSRYDDIAQNVQTPIITTDNQLVATLISDEDVFLGDISLVNVTTIGKVRKVSGNKDAGFYFTISKLDSSNVEQLLCSSDATSSISDITYKQFSESALIPVDTSFTYGDRVIIRYYAVLTGTGNDPVYEFEFGGSSPVRSLFPVPATAVVNSLWSTDNGDEIYYVNGNVGIGTQTPTSALDVVGDIKTTQLTISSLTTGTEAGIVAYDANNKLIKSSLFKTINTTSATYDKNYLLDKTTGQILVGVDATGHYLFGGFSVAMRPAVIVGGNQTYTEFRVGTNRRMTFRQEGLGVGLSNLNTITALLDVGSGNVRFRNYGTGSITGTESTFPAFTSDGSIVESQILTTDGTNIGIGTSTPSQRLHIAGNILAENTRPTIYVSHEGTILGGIRADARTKLEFKTLTTAPIAFQVNSSQKMIITNDGNVGIGTASPLYNLDIHSDTPVIRLNDNTSGDQHILNSNNSEFRIQSTGFITFRPNNTPAMTILTNGAVGIGTTNPERKLEVIGSSRPALFGSDTAVNIVKFYNSATGKSTYQGLDINVNSTTSAGLNTYGVPLIFGVSNALNVNSSPVLTINTDRSVKFDAYGTGSITGTLSQILGVTSSGDIVESDLITTDGTNLKLNVPLSSSGSRFLVSDLDGNVVKANYITINDALGSIRLDLANRVEFRIGGSEVARIFSAGLQLENNLYFNGEMRFQYDPTAQALQLKYHPSPSTNIFTAYRNTGKLQFNQYGTGSFTGVEAVFPSLDVNGNVLESQIITTDGTTVSISDLDLTESNIQTLLTKVPEYNDVADAIANGLQLNKTFFNTTTNTYSKVKIVQYYVRPAGGTYGTGDGTSYNNAWSGFSAIDWNTVENNELVIAGTHYETLSVQSSCLISGNYSGNVGIIDGENTRNTGIDINSINDVVINNLNASNHLVQNLYIRGASSDIVTNNCTFNNSGNQAIQHYDTASATHNNVTCNNNIDDGISLHDSTTVIVNGGVFENNEAGINTVNSSSVTINNNPTFTNNVYDVWVASAATDESNIVVINSCNISGIVRATQGAKIVANNSTLSNVDIADTTGSGYITATGCVINSLSVNTDGVAILNNCVITWDGISTSGNITLNKSRVLNDVIISSGASITARHTLFSGGNDMLLDFQTGSTADIAYCVFTNIPANQFAIALRTGVNVIKVDNNTFYDATGAARGLYLQQPTTTYNNILVGFAIAIFQNTGAQTIENYCLFGNTTDINGTVTSNDQVSSDPLFLDVTNLNFSLGELSPCIGAGETLSYDIGINNADWGDGVTTKPVVATKQQNTNWDIGAYIS